MPIWNTQKTKHSRNTKQPTFFFSCCTKFSQGFHRREEIQFTRITCISKRYWKGARQSASARLFFEKFDIFQFRQENNSIGFFFVRRVNSSWTTRRRSDFFAAHCCVYYAAKYRREITKIQKKKRVHVTRDNSVPSFRIRRIDSSQKSWQTVARSAKKTANCPISIDESSGRLAKHEVCSFFRQKYT